MQPSEQDRRSQAQLAARRRALAGSRSAIGIAALSALLTAVAVRRPWVRGTVDDAMVGGSLQEATGEEAVTGFVALGLV